MPERIKLILETAVSAEFISIEDVFNYGYLYTNRWPELTSLLCQIAYWKRYNNWREWRYIVEQARLFNQEWKIENW